jgi:hypothetical protein
MKTIVKIIIDPAEKNEDVETLDGFMTYLKGVDSLFARTAKMKIEISGNLIILNLEEANE